MGDPANFAIFEGSIGTLRANYVGGPTRLVRPAPSQSRLYVDNGASSISGAKPDNRDTPRPGTGGGRGLPDPSPIDPLMAGADGMGGGAPYYAAAHFQ